MLTLGIETSGRDGSVALVEEGELLAEASLSQTGRRHARTLVLELKQLFERTGHAVSECRCVAVSVGPGSFTGLRVGVVCAKTFAYAVGCPVVAVPTFEAIAANTPATASEVDVAMDAQRGEWFVQRWTRTDPEPSSPLRWSSLGPIFIIERHGFLAQRDQAALLSGPGLTAVQELPPQQSVTPRECWLPSAAQVARIGEREAAAGRVDDLWTLEPLYVRKSAAEEKADAAAAK